MVPKDERRRTDEKKNGGADWPRVRHLAEATVLSASVSGLSGLLGLERRFTPPASPDPVVQFARWQWADPVQALLAFGGWSFEEAVFDLRVAARFGMLWDAWEMLQERSAARHRRDEVETVLWWRRQGCPVPCPLCGALEECGCAACGGG